MNKKLLWIGGVVGAFALIFVIGFLVWNGTRREAINQEIALSAQFPNNQNILSAFISSYKETLGIADRATEQLDRVMEDAIKGRYENGGVSMGNGQLVNALAEAYPDLSAIPGAYDRVMDVIQAGRAEYKGAQTKLLDMTRTYKAYLYSDSIRSFILGSGYPSNNLVAKIGTQEYLGAEALKKMEDIVLVQDAVDAYEEGTMEPLAPPALPPRQ